MPSTQSKGCIVLFTGMLDTMKFNKDVMEDSAKHTALPTQRMLPTIL